MNALHRFGIPESFNDMIRAIYSNRRFFVREAGQDSSIRSQHFGICQGCPLSPFLFSIVMSVIVHDAKREMQRQNVQHSSNFDIHELLYADDTLLIDEESSTIQAYIRIFSSIRAEYGLQLN